MPPLHEFIGYIAAFLTTSSFLPQAVRVIRTQDTRAISLPMYIMFVAGVVLWLVYGVMVASWPVIVANAITTVLASVILACKIRNG